MVNTKTTINGKKVLGVAGNIAFLENGEVHHLTNEKINNDDFCGSDFTLPKVAEAETTVVMSDAQKKSNYKGKNFDPNYKDRFKKPAQISA